MKLFVSLPLALHFWMLKLSIAEGDRHLHGLAADVRPAVREDSST